MCTPCLALSPLVLTALQVEDLSSRALALVHDKEQLQGALAAARDDLAVAKQRLAAIEK